MDGGKVASQRKTSALPCLALLALMVIAMTLLSPHADREPTHVISNQGKASAKVYMEIADTDFSRMRGLMFRDRVIPILFVFGSAGRYPIHSNFVPAQFDAVYISKEGAVVEIFRKIPPGKPLVSPQKQALYLLELPPEVFDKLKIAEGDRLSWKEI